MNTALHFSSATEEWETPADIYDSLNAEFGFTFDPCPLGGTADGTSTLFTLWRGQRVFCNPPYGPGIRPFLERAFEAEVAVFLIPARTDTRWFHEICLPYATEIRFIKGRLKFGGSKNPAPFPSMIVVFGKTAQYPSQTGSECVQTSGYLAIPATETGPGASSLLRSTSLCAASPDGPSEPQS